MSERPDSKPITSASTLEAARRDKLRKIDELGIDPWGSRFDHHQPISEIRNRVDEIVVEPSPECETGKPPIQHGPHVRAAGRIILRRPSGGSHWLQIRDWTGTIQVMIGKAQVGEKNWKLAQCFDLGDIIGVDGDFHQTRTGELTIFADDLHFLSKSIETPPEKWAGLNDPELRHRMRYLDLIYTDGVRERFLRRTKIVQSIRNTLAGQGFIEVEGPTLHAIAGGAAARPFVTHHNALDID
ncbi:MAG: amino acid--tRNA ligase-related protein, partial [Thermoguttaceae bacterium]